MNRIIMKNKRQKVSWLLSVAAAAAGAAALLLYLATGTTATPFVTSYSITVIAALAAGVTVGIVSLIVTQTELLYLQYVVFFFSFGSYIASLIELFGGMVYGEETAVMPASCVCIAACAAMAMGLSLAAAIVNRKTKKKVTEDEKE